MWRRFPSLWPRICGRAEWISTARRRRARCIDDFQANRGPTKGYRTAPLRGLWTHLKGGFYHDGRFATLRYVVDHYDMQFGLHLSEQEKADLVEYLKSL
jgi:cytochrome c peroxidase